jgi:type IV secretion system protein VirB8
MIKNNKKEKNPKLKIKSWYSNRYQIVIVQRNILLLFTIISMFSVAVSVFFVKNIMSSKSLDPYVIEVEKKTGVATVVDQLTSQRFTGDQAIRQYFINQFIQAATAYDPRTYKKDVEVVRLFSTPAVYSQFFSRINARKLGTSYSIGVRVKSIQFPDSSSAKIRLLQQTTFKDAGRDVRSSKDLIIDMKFYFSPQILLTKEERLINPLGFQVSQYLIAEEVYSQ